MSVPQIMIVEDERIVAADIQQTLEGFGFSVVGVESSGEGAIRKAELLKPDLVLMDIMLKGRLNGIEAAFRIGSRQDIPIVYVTAYADDHSFTKALNTNPYGYLIKPFGKKDLRRVVETALGKHNTETSVQKPEIVYDSRTAAAIIPSEEASSARAELNHRTGKEDPPFAKILNRYNTDLLTLTCELRQESVPQRTINLLIKVCYKLAEFKIRKNINRLQNINKRWQLSVEDIAIDSISTLFINNAKRGVLNLRISLDNWIEPVQSNFDALFFLNKTVSLSVEQRINKIFREADPSFAKVLDTFSKTVKKYNFSRVDYFGAVYLTMGNISSIPGSAIEREEFLNIPLDLKLPKQKMLQYLLNYMEENTAYFPAVPLNVLVERILGVNSEAGSPAEPQSASCFSRFCMNDIILMSFRNVEEKLKEAYLTAGKIDPEEYGIMLAALGDIKEDLIEGNTIWSVYEYFRRHAAFIPQEEYKMRYQNIMEYMVKMFKQLIARELKT